MWNDASWYTFVMQFCVYMNIPNRSSNKELINIFNWVCHHIKMIRSWTLTHLGSSPLWLIGAHTSRTVTCLNTLSDVQCSFDDGYPSKTLYRIISSQYFPLCLYSVGRLNNVHFTAVLQSIGACMFISIAIQRICSRTIGWSGTPKSNFIHLGTTLMSSAVWLKRFFKTAEGNKKYLPFYLKVNNGMDCMNNSYFVKNWMTTWLRSCDTNASGDAANPWSAQSLHGKFASVTNRFHIAWTQTGRQSILMFTFCRTINVKCKFLT